LIRKDVTCISWDVFTRGRLGIGVIESENVWRIRLDRDKAGIGGRWK
jgi:hypothetical protein